MIVKIKIPSKQKLNININDIVNFDKQLFKLTHKKNIVIPIAKQLNIKPIKIYDYLKKLIDEKVSEGEILAEKKSFLSHKKIRSEYTGKIIEIHHDTGDITLETETEDSSGFKNISGKIINISKDLLEIELKDCYSIEINSTNISQLSGNKLSIITRLDQIKSDTVANKAVFIKKINPYLEAKLLALKTKLIITTKKPNSGVKYIVVSKIKDLEKIETDKRNLILVDPEANKLYLYNDYNK
ncbi:MAG: hypothetical protein KatS3mg090_0375 [Patescibacteria group bacterium]|nr:MAG: hypothetical protein KatS3mg090_0375 [Patescibacteria group bacterium]